MKHALAVVAGIVVGLPVMAALASANGHTRGGLPDRYVPIAQHRLRTGYAAIRTSVRTPRPKTVRRSRVLVSTSPYSHTPSPSASSEPAMPSAARPGRPGRYAEPAAGLSVTIDAPRTVRPGGTYTYRIRLANRGRGTPGEITVRNTLPSGVVRTGTSLPGGAGGYAGGRDTTLVMPRLAPGRSATARFAVRVRRNAHGELVARSRIASIDGARVRREGGNVAKVATRVR
ncbi:hypothetical protein GCM10027176_27340 [Actinoallomurus bryophytorum]|uniref:Putative repeat protein (TIGR01451 family) n=1 Tax=Actinoallomurus bryophytorum TaxID=1490222 RepID=A0A543CSA3_9ACTN|nr:DUF11 domain-containing protein [Actinoallomurus bryophytorum]TQL99986.1 putative repeat protein (TIGR01451 family) [Actinoallomurus bryophytorum]